MVDLTVANGWIPVQQAALLQKVAQTSAIETYARKVQMTSEVMNIPSMGGANLRIVDEFEDYPEADLTFDDQLLKAFKYGEIFPLSWEDTQDANINSFLAGYRDSAFSDFAVKYDNACLGVEGVEGTTQATRKLRPFKSVYQVAKEAGNLVQVEAGDFNFNVLNNTFGEIESSEHFGGDTIVIASPRVKAALRGLTDANGNLVYSQGVALSGAVGGDILDNDIVYSRGAVHTTAQSGTPTGNPLLIVGSRSHLVNGVRSPLETKLNPYVGEKNDTIWYKTRVRRGFKVTQPEAFQVVEILPNA